MSPRTAFFFRVRGRQALGTAGCAVRRGSAGAIVGERIEGRPGRPGREEAAGRDLQGNGAMFDERVSGFVAGPAPAVSRGVSGAGRRPAGGAGGVERGVWVRRAGFVRTRRAESVHCAESEVVRSSRIALDNCHYRAQSAQIQSGDRTAAKPCRTASTAARVPHYSHFPRFCNPPDPRRRGARGRRTQYIALDNCPAQPAPRGRRPAIVPAIGAPDTGRAGVNR